MDFTEKFIENVKKYQVLYDVSHPDYKNIKIKNQIWDVIALDIEEGTGGELKKRWKNLKDSYGKHLRAEQTQNGQTPKHVCRYKSWPWAKHMEHFRSFMPTESNITETTKEVDGELLPSHENIDVQLGPLLQLQPLDQDSSSSRRVQNKRKKISETSKSSTTAHGEILSSTEYIDVQLEQLEPLVQLQPLEQDSSFSKRRKKSSVDKVINYLEKKRAMDQIDLVFQGYAASVKRLSPKNQVMIKFKVAQLIMEAELAELEDQNDNQNISSSYPGQNIVKQLLEESGSRSEQGTRQK